MDMGSGGTRSKQMVETMDMNKKKQNRRGKYTKTSKLKYRKRSGAR